MKLPAVPGLDIALSVDGADLKEFDDGESESDGQGPINSAASFVEAVPGGNFAVEFRTDVAFPWRHNDLELAVYLDGVYASGKVMYPRAHAGGYNPTTVLGRIEVHNGRSFHRKFAFADLTTSETSLLFSTACLLD